MRVILKYKFDKSPVQAQYANLQAGIAVFYSSRFLVFGWKGASNQTLTAISVYEETIKSILELRTYLKEIHQRFYAPCLSS